MDDQVLIFYIGSFSLIFATCLATLCGTFLYYTFKTEQKLENFKSTIKKLNGKVSKQVAQIVMYEKLFNCHVNGCNNIGTNVVPHKDAQKCHIYCIHHKDQYSQPFVNIEGPDDNFSESESDYAQSEK